MQHSLPKPGQPQVILSADGTERLLDLDLDLIQSLYREHGALVFRGFRSSLEEFGAFAKRFCPLAVHNDSSNRAVLDSEQTVQSVNLGNKAFPLHPELSREPWKPDSAFFYCITPPSRSGQTTICDGIAIVDALPDALRNQMAGRRIVYEIPCSPAVLEFWLGTSRPDAHLLRNPPKNCPFSFDTRGSHIVRRFSRPLLHSPRFQEKLAFGNFLLFARYLRGVFNFPLLDDLTPVPPHWVEEIKQISDRLTVPIGWQAKDVVMLDNSRFMHGRTEVMPGDHRMIATYFGYLRDAILDVEEPIDPPWRKPGFYPPTMAVQAGNRPIS